MARTTRPSTPLGQADSVFVAGLGRFGSAVALELAAAGVDVLAADTDPEVVERLGDVLGYVVRADTTREDVLRQLAVPDFSHAVVAIGTNLEASILTTSWLVRFQIPTVWAKALTDAHGQILEQLGVQHVVHPEVEMGRRTAHLLRGALADYEDIGGGFAMVTAPVPRSLQNKRVAEVRARGRGELNVVAVRRGEGPWEHTTDDTVLGWDATVIVIGPSRQAERFIDL